MNSTREYVKNTSSTSSFLNKLITAKEQYPILNKEEERAMIEKYRDNREELNRLLILHNMRLVFSIAKKYSTRTRDYDDMIQRGMYGLADAAATFDIDRGTKFSTHAQIRIFKYVLNEFYNTQNVELDNNATSINSMAFDEDSTTTFENCLTDKVHPLYHINDQSTLTQISNDSVSGVLGIINNYVQTSADFDKVDKMIYDCIYNRDMKPREISAEYNLESKVIMNKKYKIIQNIKNFLSEKFSINSIDDVVLA